MKKLLFIIFTFCSIYSTNSQALVGYFIKKSSLKTIGAIAAGSGSATFLSTLAYATFATTSQASFSPIILGAVISPIISGIGLIILEDSHISTLEFKNIQSSHLFNSQEVEIYNNEIDELNAIVKTMQYEYDSDNKADLKKLWKSYCEVLDPVTVKIATYQSSKLIERLNKVFKK